MSNFKPHTSVLVISLMGMVSGQLLRRGGLSIYPILNRTRLWVGYPLSTHWTWFIGAIFCCCMTTEVVADGFKWLQPNRSSLEGDLQAMPFYPSRARTSSGILEPQMFTPAEVCGGCHSQIYAEWKSSVMALSWEDPIYRALMTKASQATGGKTDKFCFGCHTPIGLTTAKAQASTEDEGWVAPGIDCESCHNINDTSGKDNAAYVLSPTLEGTSVKYGPRTDAESPFHATAYSALHTRSEFCSTCHNVTHPFNGVPIERTYDEWLESPYNEAGVQCQDCHMTPGPFVSRNPGKSAPMGKEREHIYSHRFVGANVTLLKHFGLDEAAELSRQMLYSAATLEWIELPETLPVGQPVTLKLKVSNVNAGHKLPTGFPEGREIWIDFQVLDSDGHQIYRSGAVRDGLTEPDTRSFKVLLGDKDGNIVDLNVWEATRVIADTRILPKGYSVVDYTFMIPASVKGPLTLKADLSYWPFPQKIVDELLGKGRMKVEIVRMASMEQQIEQAPFLKPKE